jgi:hypothetical protein
MAIKSLIGLPPGRNDSKFGTNLKSSTVSGKKVYNPPDVHLAELAQNSCYFIYKTFFLLKQPSLTNRSEILRILENFVCTFDKI